MRTFEEKTTFILAKNVEILLEIFTYLLFFMPVSV